MSKTANWSYKNTAQIRPRTGFDTWSGAVTYGDEYAIACTWEAKTEQRRGRDGSEFVTRHIVWTEDLRPQPLDLIQLNGMPTWEEIRDITQWDMSFFGETPDREIVT